MFSIEAFNISPSSPLLASTSHHPYHSSTSDLLISCHAGQDHLLFSSSTEPQLQLLFLKRIKKYLSRQVIITITKTCNTLSFLGSEKKFPKKKRKYSTTYQYIWIFPLQSVVRIWKIKCYNSLEIRLQSVTVCSVFG